MVESNAPKKLTLIELENLKEAELEQIIQDNYSRDMEYADDCRYALGKLQLEGTNQDNVPLNMAKGLDLVRLAQTHGHKLADELKTYQDIRFTAHPELKKIQTALMQAAARGSTKAANTLAEFAHAQAKQGNSPSKAALFYASSAEKGCVVGKHWMGVFCMGGFGVAKDMDKAEKYLKDAYKMGNGMSAHHLFLLYQTDEKKDLALAYKYLSICVLLGVTIFDQMHEFFMANYDAVKAVYLKQKASVVQLMNTEDKTEMENIHKGLMSEAKNSFSKALGEDRMYKRPCGFIEDQQIWLMGVQLKYAINKVLHFDHRDFLTAMRSELCPLLGATGVWVVQQYAQRQQEKGKDEKKKKARVFCELLMHWQEHGLEQLKDEKKYNRLNKYNPTKVPAAHVKRADCKFYDWSHHAPAKFLEHIQQQAKMESALIKHNNSKGEELQKEPEVEAEKEVKAPKKRRNKKK